MEPIYLSNLQFTTFQDLPEDIRQCIYGEMNDAKFLGKLSLCSRLAAKEINNREDLWKRCFYAKNLTPFLKRDISWKKECILQELGTQNINSTCEGNYKAITIRHFRLGKPILPKSFSDAYVRKYHIADFKKELLAKLKKKKYTPVSLLFDSIAVTDPKRPKTISILDSKLKKRYWAILPWRFTSCDFLKPKLILTILTSNRIQCLNTISGAIITTILHNFKENKTSKKKVTGLIKELVADNTKWSNYLVKNPCLPPKHPIKEELYPLSSSSITFYHIQRMLCYDALTNKCTKIVDLNNAETIRDLEDSTEHEFCHRESNILVRFEKAPSRIAEIINIQNGEVLDTFTKDCLNSLEIASFFFYVNQALVVLEKYHDGFMLAIHTKDHTRKIHLEELSKKPESVGYHSGKILIKTPKKVIVIDFSEPQLSKKEVFSGLPLFYKLL